MLHHGVQLSEEGSKTCFILCLVLKAFQMLLSIQRQIIHAINTAYSYYTKSMQCTYIRHLTESDLSDLHQAQVESRACIFY